MKLSLTKKFGWLHVRGGKLVRVAKPHAVPTTGWSPHALDYDDLFGRKKPDQRFHGEKWVYTTEGDLAVEICKVKNGALVGHSYLSGPAIQLNRYEAAPSDWFREASGRRVEIPTPNAEQFSSPQQFMGHVIGLLMEIKYGDVDVGAFEYRARNDDEARTVGQHLGEMWSYRRTDDTVSKAHLVGVVRGTKEHVSVHFQPPEHAGDFAATPFQIGLVLSALRAMH